MARTHDYDISARDKQIAQDWLNGKSRAEISRERGLSRDWVRKILRKQGITAETRRKKVREPEESVKALSNMHARIGHDISYYRTTELDLDRLQLAKKAELSVHRVTALEMGRYDPTLGELVRLANAVGKPLKDLLRL